MVICSSCKKSDEHPDFKFNNVVVLLRPVQVSGKNGMVTKASQFDAFNIKESLDAFGSDDFEVASLASVGALGKLQESYMSPMSSMKVADKFENFNPSPDVPQS